jgi:hypothetical protein
MRELAVRHVCESHVLQVILRNVVPICLVHLRDSRRQHAVSAAVALNAHTLSVAGACCPRIRGRATHLEGVKGVLLDNIVVVAGLEENTARTLDETSVARPSCAAVKRNACPGARRPAQRFASRRCSSTAQPEKADKQRREARPAARTHALIQLVLV